MRKPVMFLVTALAAAIAIFFLRHFEVQWGERIEIRPRGSAGATHVAHVASSSPPREANSSQGTIRIASFQLDPWDATRLQRPEELIRLAEIVHRFDVVSLQGIRVDGPKPLVPLLDQLKQKGGDFDAITGPVGDNRQDLHRFVVLYNRRTVQAGQHDTYVVPKSGQPFRYPPLVTCFRALGAPSEQAFTFTVASVYVDQESAQRELGMLATLLSNIQNDGRDEDDVILVGTFQYGGTPLRRSWDSTRLAPLLREESPLLMTTTDRARQLDNVVIDTWATTEFTGHYGVVDFMREWNLKLAEARKFSEHLPVWSEFSVREAELQHVH